MSLDTQNINVLNYNENDIYVDSAREHYKFSASRDGKTPSIIAMPLSELQYIATNTNGIHTGWLTFDEEDKEEIFKLLRIQNWKDILTNEDIEEILLHPTMESMQRLIDIDNQSYFDRVRIIMFKLIRDGADITKKVSDIIDQRYNELARKQRISSITLRKKDESRFANHDEVQELSKQNELLRKQMEEMKTMMEKLVSSTNIPADTLTESIDINNSVSISESNEVDDKNNVSNERKTTKRQSRSKKPE